MLTACVPFAIGVTSGINRILHCQHKSSFQTETARSNSAWIRQKKQSPEGGITGKMAFRGSPGTEHEPWRSIDSQNFFVHIGPSILKPRYKCLDLILRLLLLLNAIQSITIKSLQPHDACLAIYLYNCNIIAKLSQASLREQVNFRTTFWDQKKKTQQIKKNN